MKVIEFTKKSINKRSKAETEEIIKKRKKEEERLVKGQFEFTDAEGGFFEFMYRIYPGQSITKYTLVHGEICEIPIGLAKHLNGTKQKISRYANVEQAPNGPIRSPRTIETKSRVKFIGMDVL